MNGSHDAHDDNFHFEINQFADFVAFVALVRGEELTDDTLRELAAKLKKSTQALSDAEKADAAKPKQKP